MAHKSPLTFKVAPHIVEDLGLNLYTTLPRVLVEFVANAYDADSARVDIEFDQSKIRAARERIKKQFEREQAQSVEGGKPAEALETRVLPKSISISITDAGHGMSRLDLNDKFLFAGRRRRREEPEANSRSPNGRPLMGRKGLGKLAGFGVAKIIEVSTKTRTESRATRVVLDYDALVRNQKVHEIEVPDETLAGHGGFKPSGTRVVLRGLLYDPLKSRDATIENEIAYYFAQIQKSDFAIYINGKLVKPLKQTLVYAWPEPDDVPISMFVEKTLPREGGGVIRFKYRIRFTGKDEALEASRRGVRVYAHRRLAAAPSLLGADTNMHGFRMTDYLDGVVHADFLDEESADYIATDRESLRWESPLLAGLYEFLGTEIKEACKQYQNKRDADAPKVVKQDPFTIEEIAKYEFSAKDRNMAYRIATILERAYKRGVSDPSYRNTLPPLVKGIGQGNILTAIASLAVQSHPDLGACPNKAVPVVVGIS